MVVEAKSIASGREVKMSPWSAKDVLVVEHDPLQRSGATVMLEDAGFSVREASNVADAMAMIQAEPADFSLVFADVNMPGAVNGLGLAGVVADRWPSIALILVSGAYDLTSSDMPKGTRFFPKPFFAEHVLAAVSEMTDAIARR